MSVIRQRTKNLFFAGLLGALVMALIASVIGIYSYTQWSKQKANLHALYEERLQDADKIKQEQQKQRKKVLISNQEIKAGQKLTADQFSNAELPVDQIPENIIASAAELEGKITKIDISKNGAIIPSMLFEEGITPNDLRKAEYTEIVLPTKLKKDDYVDVRINFPTGQDYIVLGKKKAKDLINGTVWFDVNEQEILNMSSAIVDAYLNDAKIYALSYVDPFTQETPTLNYPVNVKVLDLINTSPNVLRIAKSELSKNARILLDRDLNTMSAEDKQKVASARSSLIQQRQNNISSNTTGTNQNNPAQSNNGDLTLPGKTNIPTLPPVTATPGPTALPSSANNQSNNVSQSKSENVAPTATPEAQKKESDIYKESVEGAVKP
ncbi:hypothetical protein YDYSY3_39570 [Paenibacillus chitinolyticus]|uniref:SAF domain-containing protein n=1 Tax=Paenibacillus chitinolyticus TaxID=79263 RepID=UPI0026E49F2F|nr:SAF domain-containing protein [Paenibacillus chitinolyticus]GKS12957.1 hypothetical protein YDYSY3_39570 [Paenibacillus chitinolyticus]